MNKTLYKLDTGGSVREWSISVQNLGNYSEIKMSSGLLEGKKVDQVIKIDKGKNVGKSNETNHYTQALAEANAKVKLQIRSGYVELVDEVKESGTLGSGILSPMLAQKYHPTGKQKGSKTLEQMKIKGQKVFIQPKLDGNRCIIVIDPSFATMYTRKGDVSKVQLDHVLSELKSLYSSCGINSKIAFDGELYSDDLAFNDLNGQLKRKDNLDHDSLKKINYHVYDVMLDVCYSDRFEFLKAFFPNSSQFCKLVPTIEVRADDSILMQNQLYFVEKGYEGLMIRVLGKGYENKRSWQLVKMKNFDDSEFKIVDLEKDTMGRLGKFIMELDVPSKDRNGNEITTFKAGIKGITHEEGLIILENKNDYVGKMATVEYFGRSEYNVPRFPKFKAIRDE